MSTGEERSFKASEYVLGLMDDAQMERVEQEIAEDPALAREVAFWADRFDRLQDDLAPEAASDSLWQNIAARIDREEAAPKTTAKPAQPAPAGRRAFSGWQNALLAACLVAAFGLGYLGGQIMRPDAEPAVVVVLVDDNSVPGAIMEAYGDDRVRVIPLREFEVPEGKVLEAWTLYDADVGPVSLGTFSAARDMVLAGADLPRPQPDQLYEITLEDAPGSPVGRPLGPILVKGLAVEPPR
ncbi:MAG: anti-sigma factor [Mesorhizobium sp.]|nr:anti-sigma factor [Mesorhizobium sp.]